MPKTKQTQLHELALHYHATLYLIIQEKDEKSITFICNSLFLILTLDSNDLYFTLLSLRSQFYLENLKPIFSSICTTWNLGFSQ